jgi:cell division protein FtsI/penicillin-binding protein 2
MDVQLTIDVSIQSAVEEELDRIVSDFSPNGATVIVSEPSTGYILALGNRPTFDPNEFWNYEIENQRNRAITDIYEPGSVFKVVTVCAALNEGIVSPEQIFDCDIAKARYHGRVVKLPSDHDPLGKISVRQIVAKSSNRGAAYLGMMLGENRLYDYARSFGFGHKTGFLLGGEVNGILHPVDRWDGLTITRLPMGHAISATPMQVHNMMASVANGGVLMHPQIVRRVIDEGAQVVSFEPQQQRRVVSPEAAKVMSEMLAEVVGPDGTAKQAILQGYRVAGKTGTTQKIINGKYSRNAHVASFVGYFPADNPRVVISIVVDEPNLKGVGYGGVVAAPSFKRIAKEVIRYLGIEPVEREDKGIAYIKPVNSDYYVFN